MTSSSTAVYTITRDTMLQDVLKSIRVILQGGTITTDQVNDALPVLNMILKQWQDAGLNIWTFYEIQVPMVVGKLAYTIGPAGSGADVITTRPWRIFETGNYWRQTVSGLPYDTPLRVISRAEYLQFGSKQSPGTPNSIYYDQKMATAAGATSPSVGYGTLRVYVQPNIAGLTVYLNAQRSLFDITQSTEEFDVPQNWFMALRSSLRYHLGDYYEVSEERLKRYANEMATFGDTVASSSVEEASASFQPDMASGWGGSNNA